jgi:DNA-binding XRE family transcriptional regulator
MGRPKPAAKAATSNRVKAHRVQQMLSRAELAEKAGISVEALCKIENGTVRPRINTRRKILTGLGFTIERAGDVFPGCED